MKCKRCGNEDEKYFKKINGRAYCLKCISFKRLYVDEEIEPVKFELTDTKADFELPFSLNDKQKEIAEKTVGYIKEGYSVLIYAVCGAGKTEMVMPLVSYAFKNHLTIGMAIPRKEVVMELHMRFQKAFKEKKIIALYQNHNSEIKGDFIIATTHQMYRYYQSFDLLIVDEVDAFPYKNNQLLESIVMNASRGPIVYMSATPSKKLLEDVDKGKLKLLTLFNRPHGGKLCIPKIIVGPSLFLYYKLFSFLNKHHDKTTIVFVKSISDAIKWHKVLSLFYKCALIHSKSDNHTALYQAIKHNEYQVVVSTTILERGITISNVQIVVLEANNAVFDEAVLIQIVGRVGRDPNYKEGECLFLSKEQCRKLKNVRKEIIRINGEVS